MDTAVHRAFRFAGYTLDMTRGALRDGEHAIELRPKCPSENILNPLNRL